MTDKELLHQLLRRNHQLTAKFEPYAMGVKRGVLVGPGEVVEADVWVNLPLFDPTTGGDVVTRLQRDAKLHIIAGVLLPFALPALVQITASSFDPALLGNPQLLIWCVTGWAMGPAGMIVRGMARLRIADLIEQKRRSYAHDKDLQIV